MLIKNQDDLQYPILELKLEDDFDTKYLNSANLLMTPLTSSIPFLGIFDKAYSSSSESSNLAFFVFPDDTT